MIYGSFQPSNERLISWCFTTKLHQQYLQLQIEQEELRVDFFVLVLVLGVLIDLIKLTYHLDICTSIVETFRSLPSSDCIVCVPIFTCPILYPILSIRFTIIWATSTARVMLFPLAFTSTVGSFANCD